MGRVFDEKRKRFPLASNIQDTQDFGHPLLRVIGRNEDGKKKDGALDLAMPHLRQQLLK